MSEGPGHRGNEGAKVRSFEFKRKGRLKNTELREDRVRVRGQALCAVLKGGRRSRLMGMQNVSVSLSRHWSSLNCWRKLECPSPLTSSEWIRVALRLYKTGERQVSGPCLESRICLGGLEPVRLLREEETASPFIGLLFLLKPSSL